MSKRIISNSTQFSPMPGSEGNLSGTFLFCILFHKINQDLNKSSRKVFICITQIHIYHLTQTPPNFSCLRTVICPCLHWKVFIWKRVGYQLYSLWQRFWESLPYIMQCPLYGDLWSRQLACLYIMDPLAH